MTSFPSKTDSTEAFWLNSQVIDSPIDDGELRRFQIVSVIGNFVVGCFSAA